MVLVKVFSSEEVKALCSCDRYEQDYARIDHCHLACNQTDTTYSQNRCHLYHNCSGTQPIPKITVIYITDCSGETVLCDKDPSLCDECGKGEA